tara:strand:- start:46 stop:282 length:237 start_codon:yes stop_codon:yes gene_type:complete
MIDFIFIKDVFKEVFELDEYELTLDSAFESVPGWDSLGHLRLISEIEEKLEIEFEIEEIIGVNTVEKILALVNSKINS